VIARTSAFVFKGKLEDIREIGKKLDVGIILEGSVRKAGDRLRITAQLINVTDGSQIWSERYDRKLDDVFAIQDEVALAIVDVLKVKLLGEEKKKVLKSHTEDVEAYNLYLKGNFFQNRRTADSQVKAQDYFERALKRDPNFALPYAYIARTFTVRGIWGFLSPSESFPKAKIYSEKALDLDANIAEAWMSLGLINTFYDWTHEAAEKKFLKAFEINPGNATVHYGYGLFLMCMGRYEESIREMRKAVELDPLSAVFNSMMGTCLRWAHRDDEARIWYKKADEIDSTSYDVHYNFAIMDMLVGKYKGAIASFKKAIKFSGGMLSWAYGWLVTTYVRAGDSEQALKILCELEKNSKERYVSPSSFYIAYYSLGEQDKAFKIFEKAYENRDPTLLLYSSPEILSQCHDPRCDAVLKKVVLTKI
jgi:Tfp pilus assembly protein PilF